jgi:hypothetical protein
MKRFRLVVIGLIAAIGLTFGVIIGYRFVTGPSCSLSRSDQVPWTTNIHAQLTQGLQLTDGLAEIEKVGFERDSPYADWLGNGVCVQANGSFSSSRYQVELNIGLFSSAAGRSETLASPTTIRSYIGAVTRHDGDRPLPQLDPDPNRRIWCAHPECDVWIGFSQAFPECGTVIVGQVWGPEGGDLRSQMKAVLAAVVPCLN